MKIIFSYGNLTRLIAGPFVKDLQGYMQKVRCAHLATKQPTTHRALTRLPVRKTHQAIDNEPDADKLVVVAGHDLGPMLPILCTADRAGSQREAYC